MKIALVVFDWAGTLVDFGCRAPMGAFLEAFADAGLPIDEATARKPMGAHKRDHVREILGEAEIIARVRRELKREPDETLVDEIYGRFGRRLPARLPAHAEPIPGAVETLQWLRARGVRIGSTTGYTRAMMDVLEPVARAAGIAPDALICADEVPQARPAPWACFRLAERFGVFPMSRCVKVGDTPADMAEGLNAGMRVVAVSESGNEVGLSRAELAALDETARNARIAAAAERLRAAGAQAVLRSVAELPAWLERNA
jgi:phosphonoacetaldehyde hydrolase